MKPQGIDKIIFFSVGRLIKNSDQNTRSLSWGSGIKPEDRFYLALSIFPSIDSTNYASIFNIVTYILIFIFIIIIAILVERQIQISKKQSIESIRLLEKERMQLEKRISERTLELISTHKAVEIEELERVARFGELSQGLFHDLINPLTAASLSIEHLAEGKTSLKDAQQIIHKAIDASRRMNNYMNSIKSVIGKNQHTQKIAETNTCLSIVLDLLAYKSRLANVEIKRTDKQSYTLKIDPLRLQQVFLNIISNSIEACEHLKEGQEKIILIDINKTEHGIIINITDTGPGINHEHLSLIFKKSFTTKKEGLGFGLHTVKNIVENELNGSIHITNAPISGACCEIRIPVNRT